MNIAFLASHNGTNMQAVLDACAGGILPATPVALVCNNPDAGCIARAESAGLPFHIINAKSHPDATERDNAIAEALRHHAPDIILLAGYMKKIGPRVLAEFAGRIINIHPALLPRHGGQGMYGINVHRAVLAAGDAETGITIHLVDEHYDHGRTLAQRTVPVEPGDTPESLAARVLTHEHAFLIETIRRIAHGEIGL